MTTPSESLVIVRPSFACKAMDWIGAEVIDVGFRSVTTESFGRAPISQTLTDLSLDAVIREEGEENSREVIGWVWPAKIPTR